MTAPGLPPDVGPADRAVVTFLQTMAAAPDGDTVLRAAVDGLLRPYRASSAALYLPTPDGRRLRAAAWVDPGWQAMSRYTEVPVDVPLPVTEVYRSGLEQFVLVRQAVADFPLLAGWAAAAALSDDAEVATMPLVNRSATVGVLLVLFPAGVDRTWRLRALLDGLTSALTIWIAGLLASDALASSPSVTMPPLRITPRQREVLAAVREGRSNTEIARALGFSVSTIKVDLADLFRLLGATNRVELVDKAIVSGLLDVDPEPQPTQP